MPLRSTGLRGSANRLIKDKIHLSVPCVWERDKIFGKVGIFLAMQREIAKVATKGSKNGQRMSNPWHKESDEERRAMRWRRFWDGAWVYAAAIALLILISLSRIIIVSDVAGTLG